MKYSMILIQLLFFIQISTLATQQKKIKKSFKVGEKQNIEILDFSGSDLKIRSWDKNEVMFNIVIKMKSSDNDYEKAYVRDFEIIKSEEGSSTIFEILESDYNPGINFLGLFTVKFFFYSNFDIKGEIIIPNKNPLFADFRYCDIKLENMEGSINIEGKGNKLDLQNCENVLEIENNYGDINIQNCEGDLDLFSKSNKIEINNFVGPINIQSEYSKIKLENISENVEIDSKSAEIELSGIEGDVEIDSDYSDIKIQNINGSLSLDNKSGNVNLYNIKSFDLNSEYTEFVINKVTSDTSQVNFIHSKSGEIDIRNMIGNLTIDDTYSNMNLMSVMGNVSIFTKSNVINAKNIIGNWISETTYSSITIEKLNSKKVNIENKNKDITVELDNLPREIIIENSYGNVDLNLFNKFSGTISLETRFGNIDTNFPLHKKITGNRVSAEGKIGTGNSRLSIKNKSGDIYLTDHLPNIIQ